MAENSKQSSDSTINVKNPPQNIQKQIVEGFTIFLETIIVIFQIIYDIGLSTYRIFRPEPLKPVKNEIVLITGAGHGIGKELALRYASEGATVVCWDINEQNNNSTVKEIEAAGYAKAYGYVCDVSIRKNISEVAKKVKEEVGDVTILINNAGIMPTHPLEEHTEEEIDKIMKINIYSHFWTIQEFLPAMKKLNHGHIVALSSIAGVVGLQNLVPYCASKFAVRGLMEALNEELRVISGNKIEVTTVCPYMVDTGLCKKPIIKFPNLMPLLKPKSVAKAIMVAQRNNVFETTVPAYLLHLNYVVRNLPLAACYKIKDFIRSGVESDLS